MYDLEKLVYTYNWNQENYSILLLIINLYLDYNI